MFILRNRNKYFFVFHVLIVILIWGTFSPRSYAVPAAPLERACVVDAPRAQPLQGFAGPDLSVKRSAFV